MNEPRAAWAYISWVPRAGYTRCTDPDCRYRHKDHYHEAVRAADHHRRLSHAEDYVRDALRIMGQHDDANNPAMVRETAERVLLAIYGRNLPR